MAQGWEVDDSGKTSNTGDTTKYVYGIGRLDQVKGFYIDFEAENSYHAIFFLDSSGGLISSVPLEGNFGKFILAPTEAVSFCMRFTTEDPAFEKVRTTDFVFSAHAVNPYYKKLEKKLAKEAGQEYYTESLSGQLRLVGDDFNLVYDSGINTRFRLTLVDASAIGSAILTYDPYYTGDFNKTNCKFDYFKKTCEPKIQTADEYKLVLNRYKDKFNLAKLGVPSTSVTCTKRPFTQIYIGGSNSVTNIFNGQAWDVDVNTVLESNTDLLRMGFSEVEYLKETYIENAGAGAEDINGIYSEFEASQVMDPDHGYIYKYRWYKTIKNIRTHYIESVYPVDMDKDLYEIGIYRVGSDEAVYYVRDPHKLEDGHSKYFNRKSDFTGLAFTGPYGNLVIHKDIHYAVYARLVHGVKENGEPILLDDFAAVNTKAYKYYTGLSSNSITVLQSTDSIPTETQYGMNDYEEYFTPQFLPELSENDRYIPIGKSAWANSSLWLAYTRDKFSELDSSYSKQFVLRDAWSISSVISKLLEAMGSSVVHDISDSEFLSNPSIMEGAENFRVYITQKTNMIYGTYDQAAQKAEASLEMIMNMLRDCFRCYWYIANGRLKIEHISYFINGRSYRDAPVTEDFEARSDYYNNKPALYGQGEISYDVSGLPRKYTFAYGDESLSPFTGVSLDIEANYLQEDVTESINVGDFSADIDYMQISADQVSQDGFALLCPKYYTGPDSFFGHYEIPVQDISLIEDSLTYTTKVQNVLASWAKLAELYSWDMPAQNVKCNVLPAYTVNGTKPIKQQSIEIPYYPGLVPFGRIKTGLLEGQIESISEAIDTGYLSINLKGQE
jgi:hypothetical protein